MSLRRLFFILVQFGLALLGGQLGGQGFYDPGAVGGGGGFEGGVVHLGGAVGLVGDGAEDDEGQAVADGALGDGGALHLGAVAVELLWTSRVLDGSRLQMNWSPLTTRPGIAPGGWGPRLRLASWASWASASSAGKVGACPGTWPGA